MAFQEELKIFDDYVKSKGLKQSGQRKDVLLTFLRTEKHLTADELFRLVKKKNPSIGVATVYRTLKLICESGLGREFRLGSDSVLYEHNYNHDHHDHLICTGCGKITEVVDPEIEKLQEKLAKKSGFKLKGHKLLMYGTCRKCNH
jgi:Fur family ferric uptake transcriptional regulator